MGSRSSHAFGQGLLQWPFFLLLAFLWFSLFQSTCRASTIVDSTPDSSVKDGTISSNEYGNLGYYSFGVNSGWGNVIGSNSRIYFDSSLDGQLNLALQLGGGYFNSSKEHPRDAIVIYLDSIAEGLSSTLSIDDVGDDGFDHGRAAISGRGIYGGNAEVFFASGFRADYAIAIESYFAGLFRISADGSLTFIKSLEIAPYTNAAAQQFEMILGLDDVGLAPGGSFKYVATLMDADYGYRSNEFHGATYSGPNLGNSSFTFDSYNVFRSVAISPIIAAVSPQPVPAQNEPQSFTISGGNFASSCTVTLRDLRTGETFPNRTKVSQTNSQIVLNPNFTNAPAEWTVEVINPGGLSSGQFHFQVGEPVIPGQTISKLSVEGQTSLNAGASCDLQAILHYTSGTTLDVTEVTSWNLFDGAPIGTKLIGGRLTAGAVSQLTAVALTARYATNMGAVTSQPFTITITPALGVKCLATRIPDVAGTRYSFAASSTGATGSVAYSWDIDGNGAFGDKFGASVEQLYTAAQAGPIKVSVRATDSGGAVKVASVDISVEKPPATNEPQFTSPRRSIGSGATKNSAGTDFQFVSSRTPNGLIVLTHGVYSGQDTTWLYEMAKAIETRLGPTAPNVVVYTWDEYSNPGELPFWASPLLRAIASAATYVQLHVVSGIARGAEVAAYAADFLIDIYHVRGIAETQGRTLASWIQLNSRGTNPQIDLSQPIHLIGHSAGGFLVGEAGLYLKNQYGLRCDMVTMLDTPLPYPEHLKVFPNPGIVQRIISSVLGDCHFPETRKLTENDHHQVFRVNQNPLDHFRSYRWYTDTIRNSSQSGGFNSSPFILGASVAATANANLLSFQSSAGADSFQELTNFSTFGSVSQQDVSTYILTEQVNSGIFSDVTIPSDAQSLTFRFRFIAPGDGDFLAVQIGDYPPLYIGLDLPADSGDYVTANISLFGFNERTDKLVFTLISRGAANAVIELTGISFVLSDDVDFDGLTNSEEVALGLNPYDPDTDGDGLSDFDELNLHGTDARNSDSDGDGKTDPLEIAAGTDPLSNSSFLRITTFEPQTNGSNLLKWSSVSGKKYRVRRTENLATMDYITVGTGIPGVVPEATFTDPSPPIGKNIFYWVEVEPL